MNQFSRFFIAIFFSVAMFSCGNSEGVSDSVNLEAIVQQLLLLDDNTQKAIAESPGDCICLCTDHHGPPF